MCRGLNLYGIEISITPEEEEEYLSQYIDQENISKWARKEVAACIKAGIIKGDMGEIRVKETITRAETAALLKRVLELIMSK